MDKEMEETVLKIADYSNHEKQRIARRMCGLFVIGLVAFTAYLVMDFLEIADTFTDGFIPGITLGITYGMLIVGVLYTSGHLEKLWAAKRRLLKRGEK